MKTMLIYGMKLAFKTTVLTMLDIHYELCTHIHFLDIKFVYFCEMPPAYKPVRTTCTVSTATLISCPSSCSVLCVRLVQSYSIANTLSGQLQGKFCI